MKCLDCVVLTGLKKTRVEIQTRIPLVIFADESFYSPEWWLPCLLLLPNEMEEFIKTAFIDNFFLLALK